MNPNTQTDNIYYWIIDNLIRKIMKYRQLYKEISNENNELKSKNQI